MASFDQLLACAGSWQGTNRVQTETGTPINDSPSSLAITPILRDTFLRIDQTWAWKNEPQIGSLLIGYNSNTELATIHWIDTWHNGRRVMPLEGRFDEKGKLVAHGHFPVANQPDWGWRVEISISESELKIDMFCVRPDGKDDGWVWSRFTRGT